MEFSKIASEPNLLRKSLYNDSAANSYRLTVDDLYLFRKKSFIKEKNNLHLANDSLKDLVSEYKYSYGVFGGRKPNLDADRPKYLLTTSRSFNSLKELTSIRNRDSKIAENQFDNNYQSFIKISGGDFDFNNDDRDVCEIIGQIPLEKPPQASRDEEETFNGKRQRSKAQTDNWKKKSKSKQKNKKLDNKSTKRSTLESESEAASDFDQRNSSGVDKDQAGKFKSSRNNIIKFISDKSSPVTFRFEEKISIKDQMTSQDMYSVNWSHSFRLHPDANPNQITNNDTSASISQPIKPKGILKNKTNFVEDEEKQVYESKSKFAASENSDANDNEGTMNAMDHFENETEDQVYISKTKHFF